MKQLIAYFVSGMRKGLLRLFEFGVIGSVYSGYYLSLAPTTKIF